MWINNCQWFFVFLPNYFPLGFSALAASAFTSGLASVLGAATGLVSTAAGFASTLGESTFAALDTGAGADAAGFTSGAALTSGFGAAGGYTFQVSIQNLGQRQLRPMPFYLDSPTSF